MAYDSASVSISAYADTNGTVTVEAPTGEWGKELIKALALEAVESLHGDRSFMVGEQISYLDADRTRLGKQMWAFRIVPRG
jgi:hypothetical protein